MATAWTPLCAHTETTQITCALETQATSVALLRLLTNLLVRMLEDDAWTSVSVLGRSEQGFVDPSLHRSGKDTIINNQRRIYADVALRMSLWTTVMKETVRMKP